MRFSNAAWTENLPQPTLNTPSSRNSIFPVKQKYLTLDSSLSVDPEATNKQDISSDLESLSDFLHQNSSNS